MKLCSRIFPIAHFVFVVQRRRAHNNLFQMVKKRTLEARTKTQPNKFPNNKPILKGEQATTAATTPATSSGSTFSSNQNASDKFKNTSPIHRSSSTVSSSTIDYSEKVKLH